MRRIVFLPLAAFAAGFAMASVFAAEESAMPGESDCIAQPSADYVPGVDVEGRPVAPADTETPVTVELEGTTVLPKVASRRNRSLDGTLVAVDLPGLDRAVNRRPCPAPEPQP